MVCLGRTDNYPGNSCSVPGKNREPGFEKIWFFLHHYFFVTLEDLEGTRAKNTFLFINLAINFQNTTLITRKAKKLG